MSKADVHIFAIEDSPRYLEELLEWLRDFGYSNILTATTAPEAQEKLDPAKHRVCDVIIADMRLGKDDSGGFAILDWVKAQNLSAVVIILTANATVPDCRRAFRSGAWDYIAKDAPGNNFEDLDQSIEAAIAYLNRWGSQPNQQWFSEHQTELENQYWGQWLAIANQTVIETADTQQELEQRLEERKLRRFTVTLKQIGDFRPIKNLIQESEREDLEFKSSFQWDVRENKQNKDLCIAVLKTIAAFLNTKGGTLLIGVEDDGTLCGLASDLSCFSTTPTLDQFERHLRQTISNAIGAKFLPYLFIRCENLDGKDICAVYVRPAPMPAFLKAKPSHSDVTFFIRPGNETKALTIPECYDYWSQK
ncbi:RNA-binding domain-containing protein [Prochlorothrix hollandica]|uniref:Histidine kinase n=2 Tax=Prochlorothrix hollandica TaxID=1223 RepID=A0A0M2PYB7_PROHO|nr:RNA-binding domain-containing protein [Prochlorothrix hollandica]KKJ00078.1 histidine kinase [Prochlorothrix hollandica PCC 9006 = CALU 1027]